MQRYNAFHNLIETDEYPHARSHRTTFWGKMADTFVVFFGNIRPRNKGLKDDPYDHVGIFDYLTLGLHYLVNKPILEMMWVQSDAIRIFSLVLYGIWNIPRFLFAGLLTLICTPFVICAQALSSDTGDALKNDILSYNIENAKYLVNFRSYLPSKEDCFNYKNSFIFISKDNQLYWIDCHGNSQNTVIKNISEFTKAIENKSDYEPLYSYAFYDKETIDKHLINPPDLQNQTFRHFLEAKEMTLDDFTYSKISLDLKNDQKFILSLGTKEREIRGEESIRLLQKLPIYKNNSGDLTFFNKLKQLNIGRIESNVDCVLEINDEITGNTYRI